MKKKGFTLIELLAVIVILAIIALITVPVVIKIINNSKKGAAEDSAYGVVEAAKLFWMSNQMDFLNNNEEVTFTCRENKTCTTVMSGSANTMLELTGTKPTGGTVKIKNGAISVTNLKFGEYYCNKAKTEEKIVCGTSEVEAEPEDLTYIISFETDGGTIMLPKVVEPGETLGNVSNPRKIGYTFTGWLDENNNPVTASTPIASDITLYAQYEIKNVTVTFDSAGGSSVDSITFQEGSKIDPLPETIKDNYNFQGWFNGTEQLTTTKMIMNDTTYLAHWEERTVTVTFNSDGGSNVASQTIQEGGLISTIPTSTKLGYTLAGWYDSSNNLLTTSTVINESKTYTAHWDVKNFTVTFNSDGGSSVADMQVQEGSTIQDIPTSTKTNHQLIGWYDSNNQVLTTSTVINTNKTYTAHWQETHVTLTFNSDGGSNVDDVVVEKGHTLSELPTTSRNGYNFIGWYDSNNQALTTSTIINTNKTYTARWEDNTITVTFNANGGASITTKSVVGDTAIGTLPNNPINTSHTFLGWYTNDNIKVTEETIITEPITLYAKYRYDIPAVSTNTLGETAHDGNLSTSVAMTKNAWKYLMLPQSASGNTISIVAKAAKASAASFMFAFYDENMEMISPLYAYCNNLCQGESYNGYGPVVADDTISNSVAKTFTQIVPTGAAYLAVGYHQTSYGSSVFDIYIEKKVLTNNTITVSFDSDGGSTISPIQISECGSLGSSYPTPTKSPYAFYTWLDSGENQVTSSTPIIRSTTLHAKYLLSYDPDNTLDIKAYDGNQDTYDAMEQNVWKYLRIPEVYIGSDIKVIAKPTSSTGHNLFIAFFDSNKELLTDLYAYCSSTCSTSWGDYTLIPSGTFGTAAPKKTWTLTIPEGTTYIGLTKSASKAMYVYEVYIPE